MKYIILLLLTACGSAGEMFTDAGKCVSGGKECHQDPVPGPTGAPGVPGRDGTNGKDGKDGASCTSKRVTNGATITCTDGTTVVILDGVNGQDGADGQDAPPTAYSVVELINPCGDGPGFDEVLLRLANGSIIAHYADGNKQFLATIGPGNYVTTDGQSCHFTIDSSMGVHW